MSTTNSPFRVVVIDDSPTVRKIFEVTLRRGGYEVTCYGHPVDALKAILTPGGMPHLLFVDIELPGIDGYEVIKRVRADRAGEKIPIIVVSRRDGIVDRLKMRLAGVTGYQGKPFETQQIVTWVQAYSHPSN